MSTLYEQAQRYRVNNNLPDTGVVVIYNGQVAGWMNELRDPQSWSTGCIAIDNQGTRWVANGGYDYNGATVWDVVLQTSVSEPVVEDVVYTDIMVDLETAGSGPTAAILSIGAVPFNRGSGHIGTQQTFQVNVDLQSCINHGLTLDGDTLYWWLERSDEARKALLANRRDLTTALIYLADWIEQLNAKLPEIDRKPVTVNVWGNGADFDNPILSNAYRAIGMQQPWGNWSGRCYRTLKNEHPHIKIKRSGTHHNALDDAISQACHLIAITHPPVADN